MDGSLRVFFKGTELVVTCDREVAIGRAHGNDIVSADIRVGRRHAALRAVDLGTRNGTFYLSERVVRLRITRRIAVRLADPDDGDIVECEPIDAADAETTVLGLDRPIPVVSPRLSIYTPVPPSKWASPLRDEN